MTSKDYEDCYKAILPHINAIIEIMERYHGDDLEYELLFQSDGVFTFLPPYPEPMLVRGENADLPWFTDKYGVRHKMVAEKGKIQWKT